VKLIFPIFKFKNFKTNFSIQLAHNGLGYEAGRPTPGCLFGAGNGYMQPGSLPYGFRPPCFIAFVMRRFSFFSISCQGFNLVFAHVPGLKIVSVQNAKKTGEGFSVCREPFSQQFSIRNLR
jgi:hypothetical protein